MKTPMADPTNSRMGFNAIVLARELVSSLDFDSARANSFENYHARGLDYLCLLRTDRLTVKAYFFRSHRECQQCPNGEGWLVWPHNHRYIFEYVTIQGTIRNHRFVLDRGEAFELYAYSAESREPIGIMSSGLHEAHVETTRAGEGFLMARTDELHTLTIPTPTALAIQVQFADTRQKTAMLAPRGVSVHCSTDRELYRPPTPFAMRAWVEELADALR